MDIIQARVGNFDLIRKFTVSTWLILRDGHEFILRFDEREQCQIYFDIDSPYVQSIYGIFKFMEDSVINLFPFIPDEPVYAFLGEYYGPRTAHYLQDRATEAQILKLLREIFMGMVDLKEEKLLADDVGNPANILLAGYDDETGTWERTVLIDIAPKKFDIIDQKQYILVIVELIILLIFNEEPEDVSSFLTDQELTSTKEMLQTILTLVNFRQVENYLVELSSPRDVPIQIDDDARHFLSQFWKRYRTHRMDGRRKYMSDPISEEEDYWAAYLSDEDHTEVLKLIRRNNNTMSLELARLILEDKV